MVPNRFFWLLLATNKEHGAGEVGKVGNFVTLGGPEFSGPSRLKG